MTCCGQPLENLTANTVDASVEKHTPVVEVKGENIVVKVGSVEHPMTEEHYIEWIYLQTNKGEQFKYLLPNIHVPSFILPIPPQIELSYKSLS